MSYVALPPGVIFPYAGASTPAGFLPCDGSAVSRTTYAALYAVLGIKHGQGDGSTTFNLPDTRGVFLRGLINIPAVTGTGLAFNSFNGTFNSHGLRTGMRVRMTSGTLSGLSTGINYYAVVIDSNTLSFATTQANAVSASPVKILLSGSNSAVIQQWMDPDSTSRVNPQLGANSGANVGSFQEDNFGSHNHTANYTNNLNYSGGGGNPNTAWSTSGANITQGINNTGGNETRGMNIYLNHIIKF